MTVNQLEKKYNIEIEKKDNVFYVFKNFNPNNKILLFLAPNLEAIDKSMEYKRKNGI